MSEFCDEDRITSPCIECVEYVMGAEADSGAPHTLRDRAWLLSEAARRVHGGSTGRALAARWESFCALLDALDGVM